MCVGAYPFYHGKSIIILTESVSYLAEFLLRCGIHNFWVSICHNNCCVSDFDYSTTDCQNNTFMSLRIVGDPHDVVLSHYYTTGDHELVVKIY